MHTFGPQVHALDSILPTVHIESGLKGFFGIGPSDKINILESPNTVSFFPKPGLFHKWKRPVSYF